MQVAINNPFDDIGTSPLTRHHILYQHSYLQNVFFNHCRTCLIYLLRLANTNTQLKEAYAPSLLKLHMLSFRSELYL